LSFLADLAKAHLVNNIQHLIQQSSDGSARALHLPTLNEFGFLPDVPVDVVDPVVDSPVKLLSVDVDPSSLGRMFHIRVPANVTGDVSLGETEM